MSDESLEPLAPVLIDRVAGLAADAVALVVPEPQRQRRLTVVFRLVLALPQLLMVWLLGLGAVVLLAPVWLAALVTGSLLPWVAGYLSGLARWHARSGGYLYLLTDRYPEPGLDDSEYDVRALVAEGRLSRLLILLRVVGIIPVWLISAVATAGLPVPLLAGWLVTIIRGRLPESLHWTFAAVLRYQVRGFAYATMLTDQYPWQLFGDSGNSSIQDKQRISLNVGARAVLTTSLVLGFLTCFVYLHNFSLALPGTSGISVSANEPAIKADQQVQQLQHAESVISGTPATCPDSSDYQCLAGQDASAAGDWAQFAGQVGNVAMPTQALQQDLNEVRGEALQAAADYTELSGLDSTAPPAPTADSAGPPTDKGLDTGIANIEAWESFQDSETRDQITANDDAASVAEGISLLRGKLGELAYPNG